MYDVMLLCWVTMVVSINTYNKIHYSMQMRQCKGTDGMLQDIKRRKRSAT